MNELQQRRKWQTKSANLKMGDVAIIEEENVPIMKWPLGRVIQTCTVHDGVV